MPIESFARKNSMKRLALLASLTIHNCLHSFDKVIIWGHKLHSHTHSYIHNAFYKAFQHMGYQTLWLDARDNLANIDCSNALFITEGQVDTNIPLRDDARYILHNCDMKKYAPYMKAGHGIILQVYTDDVLPRPVKKIDDFIYYDPADKVIYMPWATDLLPNEIDAIKKELPHLQRTQEIWWIGTLAGGEFGNVNEVEPFRRACAESGINFNHAMNKSVADNIKDIQHSYMAPAIVGTWQQKVGYIPCRIFKNVSYGQMGVTNSRHVYELFKKKIRLQSRHASALL